MYIFVGIFLCICILFYIVGFFRKRQLIRRVCGMEFCDKVRLIDELIKPFGFYYITDQDIISSCIDAWQREFGYHSAYDKTAPHFNMVFDSEPIYFPYRGQTWLIEFWKGQYGINLGAEIGIYNTDTLLAPEEFSGAHFDSVPDHQMLPLSMNLYYHDELIFHLQGIHWWLTGFDMGRYCNPEDLVMDASITFPDYAMQNSFLESLYKAGYSECNVSINNLTVRLIFAEPQSIQYRKFQVITTRFAQWKNRMFLRIYCYITRPFSCTLDRLLYLYFFLPLTFRHMLQFKRNRRSRR